MDETKPKEQSADELVQLREELSKLRSVVAEYEKNEFTLSEKVARLQAILDTTVDGIITIDEERIVRSFNKAAERIFGYAAEEVVGKNVKMLQPSPYHENHDEYVKNYLRTGKAQIIGIGREVMGRRKDGSTFPLYLAVSEAWSKGKRFFTGILRDISARKRAEETLRASEEKHRALVESSSDAILMLDTERRLVAFNQAFLDLFGYAREEALGKSIRLIHRSEESFISFAEQAYPLVWTSGSFRTEWEFARKDGTPIPVEETLASMKGPDGSIPGYVAIMRDISERRKTERELRHYRDHLEEMVQERTRDLENAHKALLQEDKLKTLGAVSSELAHEIRNPLMSLGGFARRLKKRLPEDPEVEIILNESERLEKILDRIKNYLKPVEMRPKECSVNEITMEAVDLLSLELDREGVRLNLELGPQIAPAYVDPGILIQVIINVIRNAAKVMDKTGKITLETFESDQNIQIYIRAPVLSVKIKDFEHPFMPFGEDRRDISVPVCFRLLRGMGGHLFLKQEKESVVFAASLLKALRPVSDRQ